MNKPNGRYKRVPIKAAKHIAAAYDKSVVIIITLDDAHNKEHVTTYGKSLRECQVAADLGNQIKEDILAWPLEKCKALPRRLGGRGK